MHKRQFSILFTAIFLGVLIALQANSFRGYSDVITRNSRSDIFREIQILKTTNDNLEEEIEGLEKQLEKTADQQQNLQSIQEEIEKYQILSGNIDITGPGIQLKINKDIKAIWLTDITNELFSAGAEAVSVNSIRITNKTSGFDTIPNGQILLNSVILNKPYTIEAIGDKKLLDQALSQPQGIIDRMQQSLGNIDFTLEEKDFIEMKKVL